jgi:hypothetical protein
MTIVRLEGSGKLKIKSTSSEIKTANLRLVAVSQPTTLPCVAYRSVSLENGEKQSVHFVRVAHVMIMYALETHISDGSTFTAFHIDRPHSQGLPDVKQQFRSASSWGHAVA